MFSISASCSVRLSSVSSLFGKVVTRTKSVAANAGRDWIMKSRISLILWEGDGNENCVIPL